MKNTIKRVTAIVICAILMLSVLTACGESATLLPFIAESSGEIDLDGRVFSLADNVSAKGYSLMGYTETTILCDAVHQRLADIEQELNCIIQIDNNGTDILSTRILAGANADDIFFCSNAGIQDMAIWNFVVPVSDHLDIIDVKNYDKYGTPEIQECNSYKGEIIALSPMSWLYKQPTALELLIFNMDHVNKYGKTNPREYMENGAWNWETLETIISDYYVKEGDTTVYSLVCREMDLLKLLILGNGVTFTRKDEKGALQSNFGSSEMMEAIDFYSRIEEQYKDRLNMEDDWDYLSEAFADKQNSMVCLTAAWQLYDRISYEVKNYSVLPFPTGPNGEYGAWPSAVEGMHAFEVLSSCDEPELAFKVIDMICEPMSDFPTEESRISYLGENVVYDPLDAETALTTHHNGTYSYFRADIGKFNPDTLWREIAKNNRAAIEVIEQYRNLFDQVIEEFMIPNLELEKYFN